MLRESAFAAGSGARAGAPAVLALLLFLAGTPAFGQAASESQLKAAYLVNFLKYVEWPGPPATMTICLLGRTGLESHLAPYEGRSINGRELRVRRVANREQATDCQELFVPESEEARAAEALAWVAGKPVLTVGEAEDFLAKGGGIVLVAAEGRIQFELSQDAVKRAGLKVDSPMLRLARRVVGGPR